MVKLPLLDAVAVTSPVGQLTDGSSSSLEGIDRDGRLAMRSRGGGVFERGKGGRLAAAG